MVIHTALVFELLPSECLVMKLCTLDNCDTLEILRLNRCRIYKEYMELREQTRIMVCSSCIPKNMHRKRSLIKLGKPFLLKGNFINIIYTESTKLGKRSQKRMLAFCGLT